MKFVQDKLGVYSYTNKMQIDRAGTRSLIRIEVLVGCKNVLPPE